MFQNIEGGLPRRYKAICEINILETELIGAILVGKD